MREALVRDRENNPRLADMVMLRAIEKMIADNIPVVTDYLAIKVEKVRPGFYKVERGDGQLFTIERGVPAKTYLQRKPLPLWPGCQAL